jgi:hypothetical protein
VLTIAAASADRTMYRAGGLSALAVGLGYIAIIPLYVYVGAPPSEGQAWLTYAANKTSAWWAIVGLSMLTDFLFVPIALALYLALRTINREAMLLATAFIASFVVLDLAVTWPNIASLVTLSDRYASAATDAQRAAYVAAATYARSVLGSTLAGIYSIATLSFGLLIAGIVMLRGVFSRIAAWLGIVAGVLGIVSVVGGVFVSAIGVAVILASALTTLWALLVGYELLRLSR